MTTTQLPLFSVPRSALLPGHDPKCSSCAYRVFERTRMDTLSMKCLHPKVDRFCLTERTHAEGQCGVNALLWTPRAQ